MEIAEKIKFGELCDMLEKIENNNGIKEKEIILQKFIKKFNIFSKSYAQDHKNNCDSTFYCILRLLIPSADKRKSYGIQINTLGKIITKIVGLPGNDAEMFNFSNNYNEKKDFANKLYRLMITRANKSSSSLTISEIHKLLDIIANEQRRKIEEELIKFIEITSALEQKWFIRIILKNLKLGIGEHKTFQIYHQQAKELYLRHGNLQKICSIIESGEVINLKSDDILLFQYIHPMLCERLAIKKVQNLFNNNNTYYLETKWDGERFQIHIENGNYKYISRKGIDYTKTYGKNIYEGNLTPFLDKLFKVKVNNLIIDGEMMVWDKSKSSYRIKGEHFDVKNLQIGGNLRPCFVAYDLFYFNDVNYIDRTYTERINNLHKIFKESPGIFQYCKHKKITNSEQFIENFNVAINDNEEGIVIKNQNSTYKPGKRNNAGWYKLKPDYVDGVISDFDLLIIGGYYDRTNNIVQSQKYLLGVCNKRFDNSEEFNFISICTVSSGLTYTEREKLKNLLNPNWIKTCPINVEFGDEKPDVYIEPKNSIILQIRGSELYRSSNYKTIFSLRFPRIQAIRNDKISTECMSLQEFENFYSEDNMKVQKIHKRKLNDKDLLQEKKPKLSTSNPYTVQTNQIQPVTSTFDGIDFCILNGFGNDKDHLKCIVLNHSGRIVANPSLDKKKCICIAVDQLSFQVKKLKQTHLYNIIHADWLKRCFTPDSVLCKRKAIKPKLREIICATPDIEKILNEKYDEFGDSYSDYVDLTELQLILNDLKPEQIKPLSELQILEIEKELYNDNDNPNIFRNIYGFFDIEIYEKTKLIKLAMLKFAARGGIIINENQLKDIRKPVTIFYDIEYKLSKIKGWLHNTFQNYIDNTPTRFVSVDWILDSDKMSK